MSGVHEPAAGAAPERNVMTTPPGTAGKVLGAVHLALGCSSVALAGLAPSSVEFDSHGSRIAFGISGAVLAFFGLRGVARAARAHVEPFTRRALTRRRAYGGLLFVLGLWYLVTAAADTTMSVGFRSWASPVYLFGGVYLIFAGLALQIDPTGIYKRSRLVQGDGARATATILRATDLGTLKGMAKVKVEMTIDANGRVEHRSAKTLIDRATLARIEGATVDVLVDRADPSIFHVEWATLREAPANPV